MIINKIDFPIYELLTISAIFIGGIFIYVGVKNEKIPKKSIYTFFIFFFLATTLCGKFYSLIEHPGSNFWKIGFTGYGGLIGAILAATVHYVIYRDKIFIKYTILSLPLIYSFAKLGCFFYGCCYGIPYKGILSVTYPHITSRSLFPIQLVETIAFIILFNICNSLNKHKNICYITLLLTFILKFLLDFLRYSHVHEFLSNNQIVSIVLCFITIGVYFINRKKSLTK